MANPQGGLGGAYNPGSDYNITGATITGGTHVSPTLTTPTITSPTISNPTFSGSTQNAGAAGAAGAVTTLLVFHTLTDNTAKDFATVTVPNAINGCGILVEVSSTLGDGDSTQMSLWTIAVARIAAAATGATTSSVGVSATKTGATGNAVVTVAASGMTGATSATQTFTITIKNARSAGTADNHPTTAKITLLNANASGVTIAAA